MKVEPSPGTKTFLGAREREIAADAAAVRIIVVDGHGYPICVDAYRGSQMLAHAEVTPDHALQLAAALLAAARLRIVR